MNKKLKRIQRTLRERFELINRCPYCGKRISFLRKRFFTHRFYSQKCPHCKRKVKTKKFGYLASTLVCVVYLYYKMNLHFAFGLTFTIFCIIILSLLSTILLAFYLPFVPSEKEDDA